MAVLFLFFTIAFSLRVVGLIVIALAAIFGSLRGEWTLKNSKAVNARFGRKADIIRTERNVRL